MPDDPYSWFKRIFFSSILAGGFWGVLPQYQSTTNRNKVIEILAKFYQRHAFLSRLILFLLATTLYFFNPLLSDVEFNSLGLIISLFAVLVSYTLYIRFNITYYLLAQVLTVSIVGLVWIAGWAGRKDAEHLIENNPNHYSNGSFREVCVDSENTGEILCGVLLLKRDNRTCIRVKQNGSDPVVYETRGEKNEFTFY